MESHVLEESGAIQLINDNYDATLSLFSLSSSSYLLSVKGLPIKLWMSPKFRLVSGPVRSDLIVTDYTGKVWQISTRKIRMILVKVEQQGTCMYSVASLIPRTFSMLHAEKGEGLVRKVTCETSRTVLLMNVGDNYRKHHSARGARPLNARTHSCDTVYRILPR